MKKEALDCLRVARANRRTNSILVHWQVQWLVKWLLAMLSPFSTYPVWQLQSAKISGFIAVLCSLMRSHSAGATWMPLFSLHNIAIRSPLVIYQR
jgi:hypothetical protein